jgi:predicted helicase
VATTIHALIEQLRAASASEVELGSRFERLMLAYLRTDPMWFSKFSDVWLWADWPGREGEVDTGIDLVAEHRDGTGFTAVQCKCYAPTTTLDMKDLGTFFTRSGKPPFTERMIISTTNRWTKHLQKASENQDKPTVKITLGDLDTSSVDWSRWDAKQNTLARKPRKTPHPHQRDAIAAVQAGFEKIDRGVEEVRTCVASHTNGRWISGIAISPGLHPREQGLDGMRRNGVALRGHLLNSPRGTRSIRPRLRSAPAR